MTVEDAEKKYEDDIAFLYGLDLKTTKKENKRLPSLLFTNKSAANAQPASSVSSSNTPSPVSP